MKPSVSNKSQHGCLYNTLGLLVLTVILMTVVPALGSYAALLLMIYIGIKFVSLLFGSGEYVPRQPRQPNSQRPIKSVPMLYAYEVADHGRCERVYAHSENDAKFQFVGRFGGMVETAIVKRVS